MTTRDEGLFESVVFNGERLLLTLPELVQRIGGRRYQMRGTGNNGEVEIVTYEDDEEGWAW